MGSINRAARRAIAKQGNKVIQLDQYLDRRIGTPYREEDGNYLLAGGNPTGGETIVRDWAHSDDKAAEEKTGIPLDPGIIKFGCDAIEANVERIRAGKGIVDFPGLRNDTAVLIGAGASLGKYLANGRLPEFSFHGTTMVTNRALKPYADMGWDFDYAFFVDSQCHIFTKQDWWQGLKGNPAGIIAATNTHPSVFDFKGQSYFFGHGSGCVKEWREKAIACGIDEKKLGRLDSGYCALYSALHFAYKQKAKRVILVGHDFSLVENKKYFDVPFHLPTEAPRMQQNPTEFNMVVREDLRGNVIVTQKYLENQAKAIMMALLNMHRAGIEIINATSEGLLYGDWIKQVSLNEL